MTTTAATIFPIRVKKESGRTPPHIGNKDYHLVLIETNDERALVINRFGRARTWGQMQVQRNDIADNGRKFYDLKRRQKLKGDYTVEIAPLKQTFCKDAKELRAALGEQYWNNIGSGHLAWLIPGVDTKGVREDADDSVTETEAGFGKRVKEEKRRIIPEEPKVEESAEQRATTNPIWGMF
jgi:hypothetical protein